MAARYDAIGRTYTATRATEPRIAARIWAALGDARSVVNVGAGTGSYEPPGRELTAVEGADAVYTDVWVSMSDDESSAAARREALAPYRIDDALLARAAPHAFALHCLPAHPGEEITEDVLYGDRQRIWDQAENRRHAQKALLELLVSSSASQG